MKAERLQRRGLLPKLVISCVVYIEDEVILLSVDSCPLFVRPGMVVSSDDDRIIPGGDTVVGVEGEEFRLRHQAQRRPCLPPSPPVVR